MNDIDPRAEEVLEQAWKLIVEEGMASAPFEGCGLAAGDPALDELEALGLIALSDSGLTLTEAGRPRAMVTVRRHRLAERLLADVVDLHGAGAEETACRFEHLLHEGLEEKVCTLLGHPSRCPHGQTIPPGRCCTEGRSSELRLVSTVAEMSPGQQGSVAYLHSPDGNRLQKLLALGVYPGSRLRLLQRRPSFVFQVGNSQFAVDEEMAGSIHVRV